MSQRGCPSDCSGHGECVAVATAAGDDAFMKAVTATAGEQLKTCDVTDLSCVATCHCAKGYSGVACAVSDVNSLLFSELLTNLTSAIQLLSHTDVQSLDTVDNTQRLMVLLPTDPVLYSPKAVQALASIASHALEYAISASAEVTYLADSSTNGIFKVMEILSLQPSAEDSVSEAFYSLMTAVSFLFARDMVDGQEPYRRVNWPLRYIFLSSQSFEENFTFKSPSTDMEIFQRKPPSLVKFHNLGSAKIGAIFYPLLTSRHGSLLSDAARLQVQHGRSGSMWISLQHYRSTDFAALSMINSSQVRCKTGDYEMKYLICANGRTVSSSCNGTAGTLVLSCTAFFEPYCLLTFASDSNTSCSTNTFSQNSTTCLCQFSVSGNDAVIVEVATKLTSLVKLKTLFIPTPESLDTSSSTWTVTISAIFALFAIVPLISAFSKSKSSFGKKILPRSERGQNRAMDLVNIYSTTALYMQANVFDYIFSGVFSSNPYADRYMGQIKENMCFLRMFDSSSGFIWALHCMTRSFIGVYCTILLCTYLYPADVAEQCFAFSTESHCLSHSLTILNREFRSCEWLTMMIDPQTAAGVGSCIPSPKTVSFDETIVTILVFVVCAMVQVVSPVLHYVTVNFEIICQVRFTEQTTYLTDQTN